jgi:hypothetical protein
VTEEITVVMVAYRALVLWVLKRYRQPDFPYETPLSDAGWQWSRQRCLLQESRAVRVQAA